MKRIYTLLWLATVVIVSLHAQTKYVGGDISLLPSYEANGAQYKDLNGNAITGGMLPYFKAQGMNAMRVRLFVDPANATDEEKGEGVRQDLAYVVALGKQIKDAGLQLMLDFHYSDTWADPAKQWTPEAWRGLTDAQLYDKIYEYTKDALQQMVAAGATPDFIQTGNEISYGMLWGTRDTSTSSLKKCWTDQTANWDRFTTLLKRAGQACREVCPQAKIVIHTERVARVGVLTAFYDNMKSYGVDYDIIGLSYYPYYHGTLTTLNGVLSNLELRYSDKDIMIVETGYYHDWQPTTVDYDLKDKYPINGEGQKLFTEALIDILNAHPKVTGLFWWFMEANEYGLDWNTKRVTDNWYNCGLFDNQTGKALPALYSLQKFLGEQAHVTTLDAEASTQPQTIYTVDGRYIAPNAANAAALPHGLYIIGKKKVVR